MEAGKVASVVLIGGGAAYIAYSLYSKPTELEKRLRRNKEWQDSFAKKELETETKHQNVIDAQAQIRANRNAMEAAREKRNKERTEGLVVPPHEVDTAVTKTQAHHNVPVKSTSGTRMGKKGAGGAVSEASNVLKPTRDEEIMVFNNKMKWRSVQPGGRVEYVPIERAYMAGPLHTKVVNDQYKIGVHTGDVSQRFWKQVKYVPMTQGDPRIGKKDIQRIIAHSAKYPNLRQQYSMGAWTEGQWDNRVALQQMDNMLNDRATEDRAKSIAHYEQRKADEQYRKEQSKRANNVPIPANAIPYTGPRAKKVIHRQENYWEQPPKERARLMGKAMGGWVKNAKKQHQGKNAAQQTNPTAWLVGN